jgi:hypothetical protein
MMTLNELLLSFSLQPWFHSFIGDPVDVTPTGEEPMNLKWFRCAFFEAQKNCLIKRTDLVAYVFDHGTPEETAFYQQGMPVPTTSPNEFSDWLKLQIRDDPDIEAFKVQFASEEADMALVFGFVRSTTDPNKVVPRLFQIARIDGEYVKSEIDATDPGAEVIARVARF